LLWNAVWRGAGCEPGLEPPLASLHVVQNMQDPRAFDKAENAESRIPQNIQHPISGDVRSHQIPEPPNIGCPSASAQPLSSRDGNDIAARDSEVRRRRIAELNDAFRTTFRGGKVVMTAGVRELPDCLKANALMEVAKFNCFTEANDPRHERDFGSFVLLGRRFYWKIDYYDDALEFGSEDPADPQKTVRVLTLMLAQDY